MSAVPCYRCLGEDGLIHLTSPILTVFSRTPSSFQLFSSMSSPMAELLLELIRKIPITTQEYTSTWSTTVRISLDWPMKNERKSASISLPLVRQLKYQNRMQCCLVTPYCYHFHCQLLRLVRPLKLV